VDLTKIKSHQRYGYKGYQGRIPSFIFRQNVYLNLTIFVFKGILLNTVSNIALSGEIRKSFFQEGVLGKEVENCTYKALVWGDS